MFQPMYSIALWNLTGEDTVRFSQHRSHAIFYPFAPPHLDGAAVALCTFESRVQDSTGGPWSHPFLCGRVAAPDHHGALLCGYHREFLYRCHCGHAWIGDAPGAFCAACRDEACRVHRAASEEGRHG